MWNLILYNSMWIMTIDERIEALTMSLELTSREIEALRDMAKQDGENIRALA